MLLENLNLPQDLQTLSTKELETLAQEIRTKLLEIGNTCGGHLASNLGVVELTIALHTVFNSPEDKMLWDTSHQTYVHKMLTGRLHEIMTLRQEGGLSGFAKRKESEHDTFGAGHASTSISAALGLAHARKLQNKDNSVIAVFGDAALSGGMAYEALNNVGALKGPFICILNDNDMSISNSVGEMSNYINKIRTSAPYKITKDKFERIVSRIPKIGVPLYRRLDKMVSRVREFLFDFKVGVIFEEFGFQYLGPIDGHDIPMVMAALKYAKEYNGPIMVHLITKKGKGHEAAEADPYKYHGVSPKKAATPVSIQKKQTYTEIFGETCAEIAKENKDVVVITPAMKGGSGLNQYAIDFPEQFFDVGIAEEHAITFAAGLACDGIRPIVSIYSTFLQRGFDQVIHDVCLQELPVVFALDRSGLVGEDGPTHHGVFDISCLLSVPHLSVMAPKDGVELTQMLKWAVTQKTAITIRYPKGEVPPQDGTIQTPLDGQKAEILYSTPGTDTFDWTIIGVGPLAWEAVEAAKVLEESGIRSVVVNPRFLKPLDMTTLDPLIQKSEQVLVIEEGQGIGGVFYYLLDQLKTRTKALDRFHQIAIPDVFVDHGKVNSLKNQHALSKDGIINTIKKHSVIHTI